MNFKDPEIFYNFGNLYFEVNSSLIPTSIKKSIK